MPDDSGYAAAARHQAHQILSRPPYTNPPRSTPRPLAGLLHAIGRGLDIVLGPIGRWLEHDILSPIAHGFTATFGGWSAAVGIALAVGAGILLAVLLVRRRSRITARSSGTPLPVETIDPAALEDEADRRAGEGDFAAAIRLRFEAGLLRLEGVGLVDGHYARTDAQIAAHIGSPTFDLLARGHEAVAYAGAPAGADDDEQARTWWPRVPDEARSHRALVDQ